MIVPNFCFEEFRFGLHADFIVLVDFLHVLGSIEGRLISSQMHLNKRLVSFAAITVLLTHPRMYFAMVCLVCGGACLLKRLDKVV